MSVQCSGGPDDRPNPPLTHLPEYMSVQCSGGPDDRPNPPLTHLPEYMSVQCSGDPDDRPNPPLTHLPKYMSVQCSGDPEGRPNPPLTHAPELLSAPPSGADEGTRANLDDDIHNNRILRQSGNELTEDDDLPAHPPFDHYVQEYDRADETQPAPPSIEGEGNGESGQGPEIDSAENDTERFRVSGHSIAALNDAPAPQLLH